MAEVVEAAVRAEAAAAAEPGEVVAPEEVVVEGPVREVYASARRAVKLYRTIPAAPVLK